VLVVHLNSEDCVAAILSALVLTPHYCLVETSDLNSHDCCSHW